MKPPNMLDDRTRRAIEKLYARAELRQQVPMATILAKVPGDTLTQRAKRLKVTRQTYYDWLNEKSRPNPQLAKKLAKITGFSIKEIRGRE